MAKHKQDARQLFLRGKHSDSFAAHFAQLIPEGTESKDIKNHIKYKVEILWQGNPLATRMQALCKRVPCNLETHQIHPTPCHQ
jgi:hypothetical protein